MKISKMKIDNFKSVRHLEVNDIDNAFILVGKNSTGKTSVLDAIRAVAGILEIQPEHFNDAGRNIEIHITLDIDEEDLQLLHEEGIVSKYKGYDTWYRDFCSKLPAFQDNKLAFTYICNKDYHVRYDDGVKKNNHYIRMVFPKVYYIDNSRDFTEFHDDLLHAIGSSDVTDLLEGRCMFDKSRRCNHCFDCVELINQKHAYELSIHETAKLMEY